MLLVVVLVAAPAQAKMAPAMQVLKKREAVEQPLLAAAAAAKKQREEAKRFQGFLKPRQQQALQSLRCVCASALCRSGPSTCATSWRPLLCSFLPTRRRPPKQAPRHPPQQRRGSAQPPLSVRAPRQTATAARRGTFCALQPICAAPRCPRAAAAALRARPPPTS